MSMGELNVHTSVSIGNLPGHLFAGTCCLIFGVWWSTKSILKHLCKKQKKIYYFDSKTFHRSEVLGGIVIASFGFIGMIGSLFLSGRSHLSLYKENHWNNLRDWHHITIYFFISMIGVANILRVTISTLPVSLTKFMIANAFFVEAFIFYNHTHGRAMLDAFVHQLVGFVSFLTGLVAFIGLFIENNVLLELLLSSFIFLQGTWYFQIGFVLFPPKGSPTWDLTDHENRVFISMCFCWHYAMAYIIIGVNYAFVVWLMKFRLKKLCSSEVGLLKNTEPEQELEEM
ncbi:transmembrane protein 45A-like [Cavia porcellus]|uniref:transmembrane protein 45A-like n=1 Tax=Cavia porcellus TaxID=10141 RepID=UPI000C87CF6F|nr:transmembrane protein 45A-like [Cavia porcellus]